jgi:nicotinamide-nucleotide amidase
MRVAGMGESDLDQLIAPVYTKYTNPVTTILASPGDIQIYLRARCATAQEAESLVAELAGQIEPLLGDRIYTRCGQILEEAVGCLLQEAKSTVAVAESCTGGLIAQRLSATPGSSDSFLGGYVTYSSDLKVKVLGVHPDLIRIHGAVSEQVARAMAEGTRRLLGSTYALSTTGFAGPDGGTEANPLGTVYIGLASEESCEVKRIQLIGDRTRIRSMAAQTALDLLRRQLLQ